MKNIMIIMPSLGRGGQEMVAVKTARLLSGSYKVYIYALSGAKNEMQISDVEIAKRDKSFKVKAFNYVINYFLLKQYKKKLKIDVSISIATAANLLNILTKKNDKVITSLRGVKSLYSFTSSLKFIQRKTDKLFCVSKALMLKAQDYYQMDCRKTEYLYNPYNLEEILRKGAEKVEDIDMSFKTIIAVGRLQPVKGYEHLIRAYSRVAQEIPDSQLVIVGEGELEDALITLSEKMKIQDKVHIIGFRNNPYKYMRNSKVFVLTSENEGFPNALVEAMAFVPVISVNCETGPAEILCGDADLERVKDIRFEKYGILTKAIEQSRDYVKTELEKEEEMIAKAIISLLNNEELLEHYKSSAQKRILDFSEEGYVKKLTAMIEERG